MYNNGGWYKQPIKNEDFRVRSNDTYWLNRDTIIYCLYDKIKFSVSYYSNAPDTNIYIAPHSLAYNDEIYQPELYREGYKFDGWYKDVALTQKLSASEKMPPYNITLHAKWSKK